MQKAQNEQKATPKRPRPVIRHDFLNPRDYLKYNLPWACEDCSHYNFEKDYCSFGYNVKWHKKAYQEHSYELGGRMALCRFQEID